MKNKRTLILRYGGIFMKEKVIEIETVSPEDILMKVV